MEVVLILTVNYSKSSKKNTAHYVMPVRTFIKQLIRIQIKLQYFPNLMQ